LRQERKREQDSKIIDGFLKSRKRPFPVIPVETGIQEIRALLDSLKFLLSLGADILCEGYYGVFSGKEEVADFIESFL
jgi:hypothetical protein